MVVGLVVAVVLLAAGLLVALWLLIKSGRGTARVWGVIGTVLVFVGVLAQFVYQWLVDQYLGRADNETLITILVVVVAGGGLLTGVGLLLLTRAVVVAGRMPRS